MFLMMICLSFLTQKSEAGDAKSIVMELMRQSYKLGCLEANGSKESCEKKSQEFLKDLKKQKAKEEKDEEVDSDPVSV